MKGLPVIFGILVTSAATGCCCPGDKAAADAVPAVEISPIVRHSDPGFTTPGVLSMGAGDALGRRMFVEGAIARGPVLVDTAIADISGD